MISDFSETDEKQQKEPIPTGNVSINVSIKNSENVSIKNKIIDIMTQMPSVTVKELAQILSVTERTINRQVDILKTENKIERFGSRKTGYWKIN